MHTHNPEIYRKIVDEQAHAMSEAFDLPLDIEELQPELSSVEPGGMITRTRPVTEYECKAYGIEDPETAFAMVTACQGKPPQYSRLILDNSRGQHDSMLLSQPLPDMIDFYKDKNTKNTFGIQVAYFIGACQSRDRCEVDDNCSAIQKKLRSPGGVPKEVRRIVHACLLQPDVDLVDIAYEVDSVLDGFTSVAKELLEAVPRDENIADLTHTLEQGGVLVDSETATKWVNFCGKRSTWFDTPGSSKEYAYLHEPIFCEIDKILVDHPFFSALICGPLDWAVTPAE